MNDSQGQPRRLRIGDLVLDTGQRQVVRRDEILPLPKLSYRLLLALAEAAPNVLTQDELISRVWPDRVVSPETVTQRVKLTREALGDEAGHPRYIGVVRGEGYRLLADVAPLPHDSGVRTPRGASVSRWVVEGERRITLVEGDNIIGRDAEADVCLDYSTVSRHHARLVVSDTGTVLEDLGSKNGTVMDGTRLTEAVTLRNGDRFVCGQIPVVYRESNAGLPTATQAGPVRDVDSKC